MRVYDRRQSYVGIEKDLSTEWAVECLERGKRAETNESGGATTFQPCEHLDPERSVGVAEAGAIWGRELLGATRIISGDQECGSDILQLWRIKLTIKRRVDRDQSAMDARA